MIRKAVVVALVSVFPAFGFAESGTSPIPVATEPASEKAADIGPSSTSSESGSVAPDASPTPDAASEPENVQAADLPPEDLSGTEEEPSPLPLPELNENEPFYVRVTQGHQQFLKGDYPGARYVYESAKNMEPGAGETYLYLGYTLAKLNYYDDAAAMLAAAIAVVEGKDGPEMGKALFTYALIEEMRGPSQIVKQRWEAYAQHAATQSDGGTFAATAKARLGALEKVHKLDEQYQIVRERIAKNSQ